MLYIFLQIISLLLSRSKSIFYEKNTFLGIKNKTSITVILDRKKNKNFQPQSRPLPIRMGNSHQTLPETYSRPYQTSDRSSHQRCSVRKDVVRNFAKFTRKHLGVFNKVKKETLTQVFSCEFCEISKNTFFTKHPGATASDLIGSYIRLPLAEWFQVTFGSKIEQ